MKTVLVICEVKYWRDLRESLAAVGVEFLGFDKKTPTRGEIERLVAKADFVVIRNLNVAHHSVRFAKEAAKARDLPFWVGSNFGADKIITLLAEKFPDEQFVAQKSVAKVKKSRTTKAKKETASLSKKSVTSSVKLPRKKKNLPLKSALKAVKIDDEPDFEKMFKK
ncbi:DUF2325 domain-containing protein [Lactococcus nasutitermitis]|uniref:DUF2325 domain-containing protein n=1 Tax=Lactococcus nasutitermitis TaxID=1652957 RepID=A0ABV9JIR2_9LACT|nr:DUF2325 domain-containing protein [Lactococcus nasutitermitis]